MIDLLYGVFFWSLVLESVIFLFLNLPTPKGFKSTIINFLSTNKIVGYLIYAHLVFCLIALFFYLDLTQSQKFFLTEKDRLKLDVERHLGSGNRCFILELRIGFLSYTVLKIQRNKYITFMLLYVSIALNIFVHLLRHIYKQR